MPAPQMQRWLAESTTDGGPTDPRIWEPEPQGQVVGHSLGRASPQMQRWQAELAVDGGPTNPRIWEYESQGQAARPTLGGDSPQMQRWQAELASDGGPIDPRIWEFRSQSQTAGPSLGGILPEGTELGGRKSIPPSLRKYLEAARDNNDGSCVHAKVLEFALEGEESLDPEQQGPGSVTENSAYVSVCDSSSECQC